MKKLGPSFQLATLALVVGFRGLKNDLGLI